MTIYIDGDSFSKIDKTIDIAKKYNIPVELYHNTSVIKEDDYAICHTVDKGKDMVDFAIVNAMKQGDIVVTNDAGLASMALAKNGYPINSKGVCFNNENINSYLTSRHLKSTSRRKSRRQQVNYNAPKVNTHESFGAVLVKLINGKQELIAI